MAIPWSVSSIFRKSNTPLQAADWLAARGNKGAEDTNMAEDGRTDEGEIQEEGQFCWKDFLGNSCL